ncbi:MAG: GH1 family beta-glucosidase [Bacillota bacterium]|nr:GH1 family beta-glucosidase [Bacillota bacterium]
MSFPKDFVWGAATASYQVEGALNEGGRGLSIWDDFCNTPGKIFSNQNAEEACDHFHKYNEDVKLMKDLELQAYRFSIAWPRILPNGFGEINEEGLDFYDKLINELLEKGITPYITLFHWDLPFELHKLGGWMNPESPKWFANYAKIVAQRFGDRVKNFITFNEPQCFIGLGYVTGEHAPGICMSRKCTLQMAHNVMLAHGLAVQAIRSVVKDAKIGYAPTGGGTYPLSNSTEDIEAAREAYFQLMPNPKNYLWTVPWWSDPVMLGHYPEEGVKLYEKDMPKIGQDDMKIISQPLDYYGQNIYNGIGISAGKDGFEWEIRKEGYTKTACNWPVTPQCIYWSIKFLYERYKKPIIITENGMSAHDCISIDGKVHDPNRIDYMYRYIAAMKKAVEDGVDIKAYFAWSLMDNFEWSNGYNERFGLTYVDYETQQRIIKDSGYWFKDVIKSNGENIK